MPKPNINVVALAGGVGGAKLADGLARAIPPENLTVVVNTGDDFTHWGLKVCPDLDTVCYTLARLANPETGWGRAGESFRTLEALSVLGGPDWFRLGDLDLATHLERTRRLAAGTPLSQVVRAFCKSWGIGPLVLPMSDQPVATIVDTVEQGELEFQEYFVHQRCAPTVKGFRFAGIETAQPAPGVLEAIADADVVVFCPSNPWVSLDPILHVAGVRTALAGKFVVAVSPIIAGKTIKGPAAKMFSELGIEPSALAVAHHYRGLLSAFVLDTQDSALADEIRQLGMDLLVSQTIMQNLDDRQRLAEDVLRFAEKLAA